ncbi:MOSC domain-containing protein [Paracoccus jiaweipingae]|uniref:MOSC domain-containing protein n=1 Tax=unclassified Paracoccus (in: a-proteobacteria) TaxID=2688777 RepID=UPI00379F56E5
MTARLARIDRFPVKSIGGETLDRVALSVAQPLPGDREWAVLHAAALSHLQDGALTKWLPKAAFLRGAAAPDLQAIRGGWQNGRLRLTHPRAEPLVFDPATGGAQLLDWLAPFWPADKPAPAQLLRGPQALTDVPQPYISVLSLDSLAALSQAGGRDFGTDRWRGNLWVRGWQPWAERGMMGQTLRIGPARLRVVEPINRCAATHVDSRTGQPDTDMLALLAQVNGDRAFGIYAEVIQPGEIALEDEVAS